MTPAHYESFFTAMAEGGATLLGLLFVALSMRSRGQSPESGATQELAEAVVLADATLYALANGFVVSAASLLPDTNVAYVALVMSALGIAWAIGGAFYLKAEWRAEPSRELRMRRARAITPNLVGFVIGFGQIDASVRLVVHPRDESSTALLALVVLAYYVVALLRAWVLVGGAHYGPRAALTRLRPPAGRILIDRRP